jgi:hypothetical protein
MQNFQKKNCCRSPVAQVALADLPAAVPVVHVSKGARPKIVRGSKKNK